MSSSSSSSLAARYRLVELQQDELRAQCKLDDYAEWGAQTLTQSDYLKKASLQRATEHSRSGSTYWALVERTPSHRDGIVGQDDDVGDDDLVSGVTELLCHCESHTFGCVFRTTRGDLVNGFSFNIGVVFTLPTHRRQGLARFFLTSIADRLAKRPNAVASSLYSGIGPVFYDRLGWRCYPSTMATLELEAPLNASVVQETASVNCDSAVAKLFLDEALDVLLASNNARITKDLSSSKYDGQAVFATLPTRAVIERQFCVGVLYAGVKGFLDMPTQCGVQIDHDAFVVWWHDFRESTLYIAHSRFPPKAPSVTVRLLRAALIEARKFELASVTVWDPPSSFVNDAVSRELNVVHTHRQHSLASLMVFAQHHDNGATAAADMLPAWPDKEKVAWV